MCLTLSSGLETLVGYFMKPKRPINIVQEQNRGKQDLQSNLRCRQKGDQICEKNVIVL